MNRLFRRITRALDMSLVLVVGQACNLKCKNCGNFCPISLPETKHYNIKSVVESMEIILKNVHSINYLQIQGGEPFLYKDLLDLLIFLKQYRKIKNIVFATNGMILPSEAIMNQIKEDKRIEVRISDYKLSQTPKKLQVYLAEMGIPFSYYEFAGNNGEWSDLGGVDLMPVNEIEAKSHFETCAFNTCLTLENGELTYCSRATNSYKLQGFSRKSNDYLIISNKRDFKRNLRKFVKNRHVMEACRYCNGTNKGEKIQPAIQMETVGE